MRRSKRFVSLAQKEINMVKRTPALTQQLTAVCQLYRGFDAGHDQQHVEAVKLQAVALAKKYAPELVLLAEIAAVYHDIGLRKGRDRHEVHGAAMVLDDTRLGSLLTYDEMLQVATAVRHHRASTGKPETMLAKIVADADRTPISTSNIYMRAFVHSLTHNPGKDLEDQLWRAGKFVFEKSGPGGYGRKTHFEETEAAIEEHMQPIFDAYANGNLAWMQGLLDKEG